MKRVIQMELRKRKTIRLREYDYSQNGAYFITICVQNRHEILCKIVGEGSALPQNRTNALPQNNHGISDVNPSNARPETILTSLGNIVDEYIRMIPEKYPNVQIDTYVIMPDHVHMVLVINHGRANPAPTVGNIMGWFKYMTTKMMANKCETSDNRFWQRSYHDHVIRDEQDYLNICQYIADNPMRWMNR